MLEVSGTSLQLGQGVEEQFELYKNGMISLRGTEIEVFIVLHWFLLESGGIWAIPGIPVGRGACQVDQLIPAEFRTEFKFHRNGSRNYLEGICPEWGGTESLQNCCLLIRSKLSLGVCWCSQWPAPPTTQSSQTPPTTSMACPTQQQQCSNATSPPSAHKWVPGAHNGATSLPAMWQLTNDDISNHSSSLSQVSTHHPSLSIPYSHKQKVRLVAANCIDVIMAAAIEKSAQLPQMNKMHFHSMWDLFHSRSLPISLNLSLLNRRYFIAQW